MNPLPVQVAAVFACCAFFFALSSAFFGQSLFSLRVAAVFLVVFVCACLCFSCVCMFFWGGSLVLFCSFSGASDIQYSSRG